MPFAARLFLLTALNLSFVGMLPTSPVRSMARPEAMYPEVQNQVDDKGNQVDDKNQPLAESGVHFEKGQTISFDDNGQPVGHVKGHWQGFPGKHYTAAFSRNGTNTAVVELQGTIEFWVGAAITATSSGFAVTRIKTDQTHDKWVSVKSFKMERGAITILAADGEKLRLHDLSIGFKGKVDRVTGKK